MVSFHSDSDEFHVAGMGMPMIDCITTSQEELNSTLKALEAGYGVIQRAKEKTPVPSQFSSNHDFSLVHKALTLGDKHIEKALQDLEKFEKFLKAEEYEPKQKIQLKVTQDEKVKKWFGSILTAAADIKRAGAFANDPAKGSGSLDITVPDLTIRHMGGTTYNKLHGVSVASGSRVKTHMLGALGKDDADDNQILVRANMKASGINFIDLEGIELDSMAIGYPYQKQGDRISLKSCTQEIRPLLKAKHFKQVAEFPKGQSIDMFSIEAGDFSLNKFGNDCFKVWEERAKSSGKAIALGLPTDTKLICNPDEKDPEKAQQIQDNRARVDALIDAPNSIFIGSNEEEAVTMFCNERLCKKNTKETEGWTKEKIEQKVEEQINIACEKFQERLKAKAKDLGDNDVEPIGFISNGVKGVYAITQNHIKLVDGKSNDKLVNNIGAGDGLFNGSLSYYIEHVAHPIDKTQPRKTRFSEEDLVAMFSAGQRVAFAVVGQSGAQLSETAMLNAMRGTENIPTVGKATDVEFPVSTVHKGGK